MRQSLVFCQMLTILGCVYSIAEGGMAEGFQQTLSRVMPEAKVRVHELPGGVLVQGEVADTRHRHLLQEIAGSFYPNVVSSIRIVPGSRKAPLATAKHEHVVAGEASEQLRDKLQEIYPNLEVSMLQIPNAIVLFGPIKASNDISTVVKIAQHYAPNVINMLTVDSDDGGLEATPSRSSSSRERSAAASTAHDRRAKSNEIEKIRDEVQSLHVDVQRLIKMLEARSVVPSAKKRGASFSVAVPESKAKDDRWVLSLIDVVNLAIRNSGVASRLSMVVDESGASAKITVKPTAERYAAELVEDQLNHLVHAVDRCYRDYVVVWQGLESARDRLDREIGSSRREGAVPTKDASNRFDSALKSYRSKWAAVHESETRLRALVGLPEDDGRQIVPQAEIQGARGERTAVVTPTIIVAKSNQSVDRRIHMGRQELTLTANKSKVISVSGTEITRVLVDNPDLVKAVPITAEKLQVSALMPGVTQLTLWDADGNQYTIDTVIYGDSRELEHLLKSEFPKSRLQIRQLASSLVVSGTVETSKIAERVIRMAEQYHPKVINNIRFTAQNNQ